MKLNVKPLSYEDYDDVLIKWWKDWDWTPPQRDFFTSRWREWFNGMG